MKCEEVESRIPELIEGGLGADDKKMLDEHLSRCLNCRKELAEVASLFVLLKSDEPWSPPPSYWNTIVPRIHERLEKKTRWPKLAPEWISRIAVSAAVVALIFAGLNIVPGNFEEREFDLHSIVKQSGPDEIQSFTERQEIEGFLDEHLASAEAGALTSDDQANLQEVIGEDDASVDENDAIESLRNLNDNAVNDIVAKVDQQVVLN